MGFSRKPRKDSKLKLLPEERQEQIIEWIDTPKSETCSGGATFAREQLAADGIKTSERALSEFWQWYNLRGLFERAEGAREDAQAFVQNLRPGDAKLIREAGERAFYQVALETQDPKVFAIAVGSEDSRRSIELKEKIEPKKLQHAERKLALLERQAAEALAAVEDSKLSDADKARRIREIFRKA